MERGTAIVTGGASGIGAATAVRLAHEGFEVVAAARRRERLEELARHSGIRAAPLDVTDSASVDAFTSELTDARLLVNNAGLGLGLLPVAELDDRRAQTMWETNVMGLLRVTRALLPILERDGGGHIVNVGSVAGFETYPGGAGYTSTKHAVRAITKTLRLELVGRPIRITEVAPGHVETEFALVRFDGDQRRAAKTYEGFTPLRAEDVADCIAWAATRPGHVNVDEIVVRPLAQASATVIARDI